MSNQIQVLKTKKNGAGFTLIEVMVVVALMGIMAALSIVSLESGRIERELEANAREFVGIVREAQNYALTGRQIGGNTACSFSVVWAASTYSFRYTPSGNCAASPTPIASYALKNGVAFSNTNALSFSLPHAALDFSTGNRSATFTKQSSSYVVCIYADGRISDQRGAACP